MTVVFTYGELVLTFKHVTNINFNLKKMTTLFPKTAGSKLCFCLEPFLQAD